MVPIPGLGYAIFLAVEGVQFLIQYLADRWLEPRIGGFAGTLLFPSTCVLFEYLNSFGPYGSWDAAAYSQYGNLALLQLLSVTGLWGVSFLIAWSAAVCNLLWQEEWDSIRARRGAYLCIATIAVVVLVGGARMALFPPSSATVRIASLSKRQVSPSPGSATWSRLMSNQPTAQDPALIRSWCAAVDNDLLARTEREGQAGTKIVFWGKANAPAFKDEEAAFISPGAEVASKYRMYLGMALAVWNTGKNPPT
jgi:apolipoprotein N-acyltransferase